MACKMNLWSLTLLPGEKYPMYIRRDFQITNAALGEELRSKDGRSVIKVTHNPLPPFSDDSDSEFDSDIEIDDDEELDEDEFELDVEEGFKLTPKKGKAANGDAAASEEDDEEEDSEDDEEDEDFDDDEEIEETNVICSLTAGRIEQANIDLTFVSGDAVQFEVTGENAVHLLGNYIYQPGLEDSDDESDYDEHDDYSDLYDDDEELEEDVEVPVGKITEIAETIVAPKKVKADAAKPVAAATENKKRKAEAIDSPAAKATAAAEASDDLSKAQKKKLAKKAKRESTGAESATAAPVAEKKVEKKEQKQQKRTLPSGLIIEDVKVGDGPAAKGGKRLGMRYIGKLENGKQFDANTNGKPFSFVLGRGEVIRGWDEGLVGMAAGGERRLTIPAALAYGNQKLPGIPKGSTLKFDVKLVSIN